MSNLPTALDSVRVTMCPQFVQRRSPLLSSRATSLLPQIGQVDFENLSVRRFDIVSTNCEGKLTTDKTSEGAVQI